MKPRMRRLFLITGFLGAGKTTFLKNFIRLFDGEKVRLIINEFGKAGVDGTLLAKLDAQLSEIAGGSVFCTCRMDQFEKALGQTDADVDVILVEASGLSDPTGVRKLFSQTERFPDIDYQGAVCLVDAVRFPKQYATARTCVKQLAASDVAVVNKTDCANAEALAATLACICGQRPEMPVIQTAFGAVDASILDTLARTRQTSAGEMALTADLTLRRISVRIAPSITPYALQKFIEMFAEYTFRVKGFIETTEGIFLADCVGNVVSLQPCGDYPVPPERIGWLNVLSGGAMPVYKAVTDACRWYSGHILTMESHGA